MALAQSIILFVCIISVLAVLYAASKSKKPLMKGSACALSGAAALGAVNILAEYTGVGIVLNYASCFVAVILGFPGVVMLLILRALLLI